MESSTETPVDTVPTLKIENTVTLAVETVATPKLQVTHSSPLMENLKLPLTFQDEEDSDQQQPQLLEGDVEGIGPISPTRLPYVESIYSASLNTSTSCLSSRRTSLDTSTGMTDKDEEEEEKLYAKLNRYGFLPDAEEGEYRLENQAETLSVKAIRLERTRSLKWLKMMRIQRKPDENSAWGNTTFDLDVTDKKLIRRVFKGIPDILRSAVWRNFFSKWTFHPTSTTPNSMKSYLNWSPEHLRTYYKVALKL